MARNDSDNWQTAKIQKERQRTVEFDLKCVLVGSADADLSGILDFTGVILLCVLDIKELAGVVTCGIWTQGAKPGVRHLGRGDGLPRGPDDIGPQVERVNLSIRRDVPTLS